MSNDDPRTLREVAQAALDRHPGGGRELGRQAENQGLKIVATTINHIAAGTYKSRPSKATLEALAQLSGFTLEQVYDAAKVPLPLTPLRDDLPPDADLLDGRQRRVIIDAIRLFAQQNRQLADLASERDEIGRDESKIATIGLAAGKAGPTGEQEPIAADEGEGEPDVGAPEDESS